MTQPPPQTPPPYPFQPVRQHGTATAALVLGILGIVVVPGLGIVAWILGHMALKEIDANPQAGWSNRDHANIGKILGIVGTALFAMIFLCVGVYFVGLFAILAGSGT